MTQEQAQLLETLFRTYFNRIVLFAASYVHDPSLAQEIAQDTFHEAVLHIDQLMNHPNRGGWLIQTAKYKILEDQRRRARDLRHLVSFDAGAIYYVEAPDSGLEQIESESGQEILNKIRSQLTEKEFYFFQRMILQRTSHLTMAQELGITVSASQKRLERLRKKLKKILR